MCSGSIHVERSHLIADLNSVCVCVNSSQVVSRLEEITAIYKKLIELILMHNVLN